MPQPNPTTNSNRSQPTPPEPQQIRTLLQQFDLDRSGAIDLAEWSAALMDWAAVEQREEWESWVQQVRV